MGLYVCGAYAVSGTFYPDIKGTEATYEIMETDNYGRVMFTYSAPSFITEKNEAAIVICQKITKDSVYFYEDVCYEFVHSEAQDLQTLKNMNDWNQPLNNDKMTYRNIKVSMDNVIIAEPAFDFEKIKSMCCKKLNIHSAEIKNLCIDDIQPDGTTVYYLKAVSDGEEKQYFVQVSDGYDISFHAITQNYQ